MIRNNNYFADILRVCEIKDLIWVVRFQSPLVYTEHMVISLSTETEIAVACSSVCKSIFLHGKYEFTNIEAPAEGLRQSVQADYIQKSIEILHYNKVSNLDNSIV